MILDILGTLAVIMVLMHLVAIWRSPWNVDHYQTAALYLIAAAIALNK